MKLRYNYRLLPTKEQAQLMHQVAGNQRYIWNCFLQKEIEQYKLNGTFNFYHKNAISLPSLKQTNQWLQLGPSQSLQQTLRDLNQALKTSFKNPSKGFPKFKKRKEFNGSFRVVQAPEHWSGKYGHIYIDLPKIGKVKWKYHRKLPSNFSTATILLDGDKWYISIVIEKEESKPTKIEKVIGIDLNSINLVVTSDGKIIANPKFFKKSRNKIVKRQRQLAKRKKGSKRYKRKQLQLFNANKKVKNQRKDHLHKISNQITNDYDLIATEDLNVSAIQKYNGVITNDSGWTILVNMIMYKSSLKGKNTIKVNRFAPSSKTCNNCGEIKEIKLSQRTYNCDNCDISISRDINAALNIKDWGLLDYNTAGTVEINGRGDTTIGFETNVSNRYVSMNRQKFQSNLSLEAN